MQYHQLSFFYTPLKTMWVALVVAYLPWLWSPERLFELEVPSIDIPLTLS